MSIAKLKSIYEVASDIAKSDMEDSIKFNLIFSSKISIQVFAICKSIGIKFEYYDPDTSYQEDINAFVDALRCYIDNITMSDKNEELLNRYSEL